MRALDVARENRVSCYSRAQQLTSLCVWLWSSESALVAQLVRRESTIDALVIILYTRTTRLNAHSQLEPAG